MSGGADAAGRAALIFMVALLAGSGACVLMCLVTGVIAVVKG
jgi:hypothetical protein